MKLGTFRGNMISPTVNTLNIYQRLNKVMEEVTYIQKGDKKVNNQYRYVSHDQVSSALHGPLTKNGIAVIPTVVEMTQDGNRTTAKVEVSFVNIDDAREKVSVIYFGYGIDQGDKGPGKAISYACKYALLKTFCLETGDDPDHDQEAKFCKEETKKQNNTAAFEKISESQIDELCKILESCPKNYQESVKKTLNDHNITDYYQLTPDLFERIKRAALKKRESILKSF
jgi:hypothetical protein